MKICAYFPAGFPDLESSLFIMTKILEVVDMLEIGIPFSDPVADGPTIEHAVSVSLSRGFRVKHAFRIAEELSEKFPEKKILFMTYYNIVFRSGEEKFIKKAKSSGVWGIVIPDLIPEEGEKLVRIAEREGIKTVFLATPTTPPERMKVIGEATTGFVYYVSVKGVTGARDKIPDIRKDVVLTKKLTGKEVFVGFGISRREHVEFLRGYSDGVVVGSALVKKIFEEKDVKHAGDSIKKLLTELSGR